MTVSLDRSIALASSIQVSERLAAVQAIECRLASGSAEIPDVSILIRVLLKRLMDTREACRLSACRSLLHLSQLYSCLSHDCLPLLIPVIKYQLDGDNEPSEVQHRNLLQLLNAIAKRFVDTIHIYISDIVDIMVGRLSDRDPDVIFQSCLNLTDLARSVPRALSKKAVVCINATLPILKHRHSRLRCAALDVISAYMYFGAGETIRTLAAFREANVVPIASFYHPEYRTNYFALLVEDPQPKVRSRFFRMIQQWSIDLPERLDYEILLAPYLFSGFFDDDEKIRISTIATLEACGEQYMAEREEQFYDENRFRTDLEKQNQTRALILSPLTSRPSLGARLIVRSQMQRLLPPLLLEISDWKESTRSSSIALVRMLLLYAEEKAAVHAVDILAALTSGNDDLPLCQKALDCARLIGHNIDAEIWMPFYTMIGDHSRKQFTQIALECFKAADPDQIRRHQAALKSTFQPGDPIAEYLMNS